MHGLLISLDKQIGVAGIHLLSQGQNLQFIPGIFEKNQVMTVNSDTLTIFFFDGISSVQCK